VSHKLTRARARTRLALATSLALTSALVAASPADAAAKKPTCATAGKTIVKTKSARIYAQTVRTGGLREPRTYGCWLRTRDRLRLDLRCDPDDGSPEGDDACNDSPSEVVVNGRYAALTYTSFYDGEGGATYSTVVWARLSKPAREEAFRVERGGDAEVGPFFEKVFVSKRGAIAFSATDTDDFADEEESMIGYVAPITPGKEVDSKVLDHGPPNALSAKSLKVVGSELQWTNGGVTKTAPWG
jgi:hypothetical protein